MFYGSSFIFDSIPSETYDLRISNFETNSVVNSDAGSESSLIQKYIIKKSSPYYFGRKQHTPLQFTMSVASFNPLSAMDRSLIEEWLLGRDDYKDLVIVQDDMQSILFHAFITKADNKFVGNVDRGMTFTVTCKEPWGFEYPKTLTKTYSGSAVVIEQFVFNNTSADSDYLYPLVTFRTSSIGNSFSVTNASDNARIFSFTGLSANETMTVDCNRGEITSSTGLLRMANFNKKFLRLKKGLNILQLNGGITSFTMTYSLARKVGG